MGSCQNSEPVMIVVEGLDGTGKSTLAYILASRLQAQLLKTPPLKFNKFRIIVDKEYQDCGIASQLFYASTVAYVSEKSDKLLKKGKSVVIDRYWLSTHVYAKFRNDALDLSGILPRLICPHMTVILDLDCMERERRMRVREKLTGADLDSIRQHRTLRQEYKQAMSLPVTGKVLVLDSGKLNPQQCADFVLSKISRKIAA
jgi:dTMP kinase